MGLLYPLYGMGVTGYIQIVAIQDLKSPATGELIQKVNKDPHAMRGDLYRKTL